MQQLTALKSSVLLSVTGSEKMVWKMEKEIVKEVENQNAMLRGIEASVQRATTAITSIRISPNPIPATAQHSWQRTRELSFSYYSPLLRL